jgi:hypothetical protein
MPKRKVDNNFIPSDDSESSGYVPSEDSESVLTPPATEQSEESEESETEVKRFFYLGSNDKRVEVKEFNGSVRVDIRSFFKNATGTWLPTTRGVSLLASEFNDLINESNEILKAVEMCKPTKKPRNK